MTVNDLSVRRVMAAGDHIEEKEYWWKKLAGELNTDGFPDDHPGNEFTQEKPVETTVMKFSGETISRLLKIAKNSEYILHMIFTAGVAVILSKYSGNQDILIGVPIYKLDISAELLNTRLPLRLSLPGDISFKELLVQLRQTLTEAIDNQNFPMDVLASQMDIPIIEGGSHLFDVAVLLENIHDPGYLEPNPPGIVFLYRHSIKDVEVKIRYNKRRYDGHRVEKILRHCMNYIEKGILNVDTLLCEIDYLSPEEKRRLIYEYNDVTFSYSNDSSIGQLFEDQVERSPDNIAVVSQVKNQRLAITYRELAKRSGRLAARLMEKGVTGNTIAGLLVERGVDMQVAIIAILRAGGAYLPLDPKFPIERKHYMLKDSNASLLLTTSKLAGESGFTGEVIYINESDDGLKERPFNPSDRKCTSSDLAYVIYTSGTTGKPKGNLTTHYNAVRVVKNTNYIDITEKDHVLQLSNYAFDGSVFDIYGALLNGAALVLTGNEDILTIERLATIIRQENITVFFLTTALFNTLVDLDIDCLTNIKKILFGGERVSVEHATRALNRLGPGRILHVYGPTETTVYATYYPINTIDTTAYTIPIGSPLANTTVYILDKYLHLLPPGAIGEIFIGGSGLSRGYLNRPQLTDEKFVPNPFISGERLYQSGDLARRLPDGNIEFRGRVDRQVKIRGFRIEPGEIENRLLQIESIEKVVVVDRIDNQGEKYLCAYIVPREKDGEFDFAEIRYSLVEDFPDYMIPAAFMYMTTLPLTPNGKIDLRSLPEPETTADTTVYAPPRNPVEKTFIDIWADILGEKAEKIGIDTDFFQMGGHSLKATVLVSRIHKALDVKIPLAQLFKTPTIRKLAQFVNNARRQRFETISPVEKKDCYPMSSAQKRFYFFHQLNDQDITYNVSIALLLTGDLDYRKLESAINQLIARHEILRTSFDVVDEQPIQRVHKSINFQLESYSLENQQTGIENAEQEIISNFVRPFPMDTAPLMRVGVISGLPQRYVLLIDIHHGIVDAVSMGILIEDLVSLYHNKSLPSLHIQYKDFSVWQNNFFHSPIFQKQENYWLNVFKDEIREIVIPTDFPRTNQRSNQCGMERFVFDDELQSGLEKLASSVDATMYMILMAATNILFARYAECEDIVIGLPIAGRFHADLEKVLGMFVNMLALRNAPTADKTFSQFLGEVKINMLDAYENQDYQFEELVTALKIKRELGKNPLLEIVFTMENVDAPLPEMGDWDIQIESYGSNDRSTARFELTCFAQPTVNGALSYCIRYASDLFKPETGREMLSNFITILRLIIENPEIKLADIPFTTRFLKVDQPDENEEDVDFNF